MVLTLGATPALAHHETSVPSQRTLERIYPDIAARKDPDSVLRKVLRTRWRQTHPAAEREHLMVYYSKHPSPRNNQRLAKLFFGKDYYAAAEIINGETAGTWSHTIWNYEGSGAYGLGQARPRSKMLRYGADAYTNPLTQMIWFRAYANGRYGSVQAAAAHWTPTRSW